MNLAPQRLRKLHSALGLVPLALYLPLHLWEQSAALAGRDAFVMRMAMTSSPILLGVKLCLVLTPLLLHAALGLRLIRIPDAADMPRFSEPGLRWLQLATGLITAVFLISHVFSLTGLLLTKHAISDTYEWSFLNLGTPAWLAFYSTGIAAVCFHLAQGIASSGVTFGLIKDAGQLRRARVFGALVAFLLWVPFVNILCHYSAGYAIFGETTPRIQPR